MSNIPMRATTEGPAFRVTYIAAQYTEAYHGVYVRLDADLGVVHVFSGDAAQHVLTMPLGSALIEWQDAATLEPQPRMPPFGAGGLERLGEQLQQMLGQMGGGFDRD